MILLEQEWVSIEEKVTQIKLEIQSPTKKNIEISNFSNGACAEKGIKTAFQKPKSIQLVVACQFSRKSYCHTKNKTLVVKD